MCFVIAGAAGGWPAISAMLSALDNPGIYVLRDTKRIVALDHIEATEVAAPVPGRSVHDFWHQLGDTKRGTSSSWGLRLHNPTSYNASVCVFAEETADRKTVLAVNAMDLCKRVLLPAGGQVVLPM